jgi:ABC-type nitrate/sulfonate/bicarbonate transport system substrate-binding protein
MTEFVKMTGLAAVLLAAIAGAAPAAAQTTVRFGQIPSTVRGVSTLSMFIAERNGLFAREGITIEKVLIPGGTDKMVAALDAGRVDVTQSAISSPTAAWCPGKARSISPGWPRSSPSWARAA